MSIRFSVVLVAIITCCYASQSANAQGVMLRSIGAVNAAVGGTATAMPIDASGALQWNPGSISAFKKNEMSFGMELILADSNVSTSNEKITPYNLNGSTKGEGGVVPAPSMAFVWSTSPRSPFSYGLGMSAVGGAASLYPHDQSNAVLAQHGRSATVIVLQVTPTVSAQLTERLSVGVAPIIDLASLNINPMSLNSSIFPGTPNQPLMTYGTRYVWGGGFQIGALYDHKNHFKTGFMFKSPVWAEKLYFTGTDASQPTPQPRSVNFQLNLPMTLSAGISYDGIRDTIIGLDVRYLDYANTAGFNTGMRADGLVEGLDWDSVISVNIGMERKINNKLKGRLGYCWSENPIPGNSASLCISAPMITQHVFSCGLGYTFAKDLELSVAYSHAFENKLSGPIVPGNPGTGTVTNAISANSLFAGISKKW